MSTIGREQFLQAQQTDPNFKRHFTKIKNNKHYELIDKLLFFKQTTGPSKLCLPSIFLAKCLEDFHRKGPHSVSHTIKTALETNFKIVNYDKILQLTANKCTACSLHPLQKTQSYMD